MQKFPENGTQRQLKWHGAGCPSVSALGTVNKLVESPSFCCSVIPIVFLLSSLPDRLDWSFVSGLCFSPPFLTSVIGREEEEIVPFSGENCRIKTFEKLRL